MFAIVDIETTGGYASGNGITEIAIVLHNGQEAEGVFQTLVNPRQPVPRYISALTGITDEMVAEAPSFEEIAGKVYELLQNRVFVAHNVNFDFSFVKAHLENCGYTISVKKLCTVRLSRKIFPGFPSYSLGNLCRSLGIVIEDRHRAVGDAQATATLFSKLLKEDTGQVIGKMLKGRNAEQYLPPNLSAEVFNSLPQEPGVYYFENQKKEVIYVGKAVNLLKRVRSHFSNNDLSRRKQELIRQVHHIGFEVCNSELMALILESQEIRRRWPAFNRSQKKHHHKFGIYAYEDNRGYLQLVIDKKKKHLPAVYTFNWLAEGQNFLRKLLGEPTEPPVSQVEESQENYNRKIRDAIGELQQQLPSFVLLEPGRAADGQYYGYLMEKGRFYGMGYLSDPNTIPVTLQCWKEQFTPSDDNDYIRALVYQFAERKTYTRIDLRD